MATEIREAQELGEVAASADVSIYEAHEVIEWGGQSVCRIAEAHECIEIAVENTPKHYVDSAVPRDIGGFTQ